MGKIIVKSWSGESWEMTPEQIEAAYRYQERQYRRADAVNMIIERLEWVDGDKDKFKEEYGVSYDEIVGDADDLVADFMSEFDCNKPENDIWEIVLDKYFNEVGNAE